ncbi:hypothetical protein NEAUS07_1772, partial [Nematocida ausubeli]
MNILQGVVILVGTYFKYSNALSIGDCVCVDGASTGYLQKEMGMGLGAGFSGMSGLSGMGGAAQTGGMTQQIGEICTCTPVSITVPAPSMAAIDASSIVQQYAQPAVAQQVVAQPAMSQMVMQPAMAASQAAVG